MKSAREMFIEEGGRWIETSNWISVTIYDDNAGNTTKVFEVNKKKKNIKWIIDDKILELNHKMIEALYKLIKELEDKNE